MDNSVGDRGACLAREAVVNKGYRAVVPLFISALSRDFWLFKQTHKRAQQDPFGLASEARSTGGDPFAAREERALARHGPETRGNIEALRHLKLLEDSHAYH